MQAESSSTWNVGDVILDLYKVTDILGEGGFGTVYKVRHQGWNINLAVKSPKPEIVAAAGGLENFEREAETWVNLGLHPHTVSCYYVRRIETSPLVFAEYVAGGSLQDWIGDRTLYVGGTAASLKRILDIAIQFAWGLHYAHEQGLVHQDVKPANVMLTPEGVVKVTDFGLAKGRTLADRLDPSLFEKGEGETYTLVTEGSGTMTPAYCSPEQAKRQALTRRSDLWSWGLCVLEMFQGGRSWQAGIVAAQALEFYGKIWRKDSQLPQMPAQMARLLQRCFRDNPNERPRNMLAVVKELQGIYQQVTGKAYPREEPRAGKDTADTLNNRAVSLLDLGKQEEALQLWEKALQMQPQHPESIYNRGLILRRVGRIDDVALVRDMEQMQQSNSGNWVADYLLGRVLLGRDDCESAIEILQAIQGVNARREEVQRLLAMAKDRLFCLNFKQLFLDLEGHFEQDDCEAAIETFKTILEAGAQREEVQRLLKMAKDRLFCLNLKRLFLDLEGHFEQDDCEAAIETLRAILEAGAQREEVRKLLSTVKECLFSLNLKQLFLDLERDFEQDNFKAAIETLKAIVKAGRQREEAQDLLSMAKEFSFYWNLKQLLLRFPLDRYAGQVYSVCLNVANKIALIGNEDGTVKLWKVTTDRCLFTFKGHTLPVSSVYLSADGQFALSGSWDDTLKLWKVATGRCLRTFKGHTSALLSVYLSTDNRFALSGSNGCTVKLWKVATGRCLRTFRGHKKSVNSVCMSGDSSLVLSGSDDGTVKLWEVSTGFCLHTFEGHQESVNSVCISGDGSLALSGSDDGTVKLWEVSTGFCLHTFEGHQESVRLVCLSADNRFALSRSDDGTVKLWEVATGISLHTFGEVTSGVTSICMSGNGQFTWFGSSDQDQELLAIKNTPIKNLAPIDLCSSFSDQRWVFNRLLQKLDFSLDVKRVLSSFLEMSNDKHKKHLAPTILSQVLATETLLSRSLIYEQELEQARAAVEREDYEVAVEHLEKAQSQPGYEQHEEVVNAWTLLVYKQELKQAQVALERGDYEVAAQRLEKAQSQPGYEQHEEVVNAWTLLIYKQELEQSRASVEQGDYAAAAQHLQTAQSQPGYDQHQQVVNAWTQLYGLIYKRELEQARAALKRGDYATAAQHLEKAQSQPGYNQHREVLNAWALLIYKQELAQARAAVEQGDYATAAQHLEKAQSQPGYNQHEEVVNAWALLIYKQELAQARAAVERGDYAVATQHLKKAQSQPGYDQHQEVVNAWTQLYGLIYKHELEQARASVERDDYEAAAQHLQKARSQPGYHQHQEVVNAWTQLYGLIYKRELEQARAAQKRGDYAAAAQHIWKARSQPGHCRRKEAVNIWTKLYVHLPRKRFLDSWEGVAFVEYSRRVYSVCLSGDSRFALSGSNDYTVKLWEVATGYCLRTFEGHTNSVNSVCLSGDNRFALSGSYDDTLKWWEVATGRCLRTLVGHTNSVYSVCLSADGRFALSGSSDHTLKLWEVATGYCLRTLVGHTNSVYSVCLSPDGRFALSGSSDHTLKLWEVVTGRCLRTLIGHKGSVYSVCLSPDGRFALSGSIDGTLKLWEVATGRCLRTLLKHTGSVNSVCLSPDGRFALSGSSDGTLKLWEVATGRCLFTWVGHTHIHKGYLAYTCEVNSVCLSRDCRFALSGSENQAPKLWVLDWELEERQPADWDEGAQPYLENFLIQHTPYAAIPEARKLSADIEFLELDYLLAPVDARLEDRKLLEEELTLALTRRGTPTWTEEDFQKLLYTLGCAGYGWLRPEGVRKQLQAMAKI